MSWAAVKPLADNTASAPPKLAELAEPGRAALRPSARANAAGPDAAAIEKLDQHVGRPALQGVARPAVPPADVGPIETRPVQPMAVRPPLAMVCVPGFSWVGG